VKYKQIDTTTQHKIQELKGNVISLVLSLSFHSHHNVNVFIVSDFIYYVRKGLITFFFYLVLIWKVWYEILCV